MALRINFLAKPNLCLQIPAILISFNQLPDELKDPEIIKDFEIGKIKLTTKPWLHN